MISKKLTLLGRDHCLEDLLPKCLFFISNQVQAVMLCKRGVAGPRCSSADLLRSGTDFLCPRSMPLKLPNLYASKTIILIHLAKVDFDALNPLRDPAKFKQRFCLLEVFADI